MTEKKFRGRSARNFPRSSAPIRDSSPVRDSFTHVGHRIFHFLTSCS